ncbi:MAG: hypothetical protein U5K27_00385 [Desulfotignum sp.]|nr:hypothetical protein [Desulfotignum sp.]
MLWVLLKGMIYFWDEPFMGGQYTDGPDFRFLHAAEISGFLILSTFILKNYFNNFPNTNSIWLNAIRFLLFLLLSGCFFIFSIIQMPLSFSLARSPALPSRMTPLWYGLSFF